MANQRTSSWRSSGLRTSEVDFSAGEGHNLVAEGVLWKRGHTPAALFPAHHRRAPLLRSGHAAKGPDPSRCKWRRQVPITVQPVKAPKTGTSGSSEWRFELQAPTTDGAFGACSAGSSKRGGDECRVAAIQGTAGQTIAPTARSQRPPPLRGVARGCECGTERGARCRKPVSSRGDAAT